MEDLIENKFGMHSIECYSSDWVFKWIHLSFLKKDKPVGGHRHMY